MLDRKPEEVLRKAVLGMIKRNNLRHQALEPRLKIYSGPTHPHTAQLGGGGGSGGTTAVGWAAKPLPSPPRRRMGDFHFGLETYNSQVTVGVERAGSALNTLGRASGRSSSISSGKSP